MNTEHARVEGWLALQEKTLPKGMRFVQCDGLRSKQTATGYVVTLEMECCCKALELRLAEDMRHAVHELYRAIDELEKFVYQSFPKVASVRYVTFALVPDSQYVKVRGYESGEIRAVVYRIITGHNACADFIAAFRSIEYAHSFTARMNEGAKAVNPDA